MRKTVSGTNIHIFGPSKEALKERLSVTSRSAPTHKPQTSWLSFGWAAKDAQHETLTHLVSDATELAPINIIAIPTATKVSELAVDLIPATPAGGAGSSNRFILVVIGGENAELLATELAAKYKISFEKTFNVDDPIANLTALQAHLFPTMPIAPAAAPAPAIATAAPSSPLRAGAGALIGLTKPFVSAEVRATALRRALESYLATQISRAELKNSAKITELEKIRAEIKPEADVLAVQALIGRTRTAVNQHRYLSAITWWRGPTKSLQELDGIFDRTNNLINPSATGSESAAVPAPSAV